MGTIVTTSDHEESAPGHRPCKVDLNRLAFVSLALPASNLSASKRLTWIVAAETRARDAIVSVFLILLTLPLWLVVGCLIKIDSRGPVFYRQARVGLYGVPFMILKFRSMRTDAELDGPRWAEERDPRTTHVGKFIRLMRIDELPQLLNVLRGEMSLIGPRPERPHFVARLSQIVPLYEDRHSVLPGITGWAQINHRYGASVEDAREKLAYDLYYVLNRSRTLDLRILLATIRVVLLGLGAR